jgi:hypothetical protein
MIGTKIQQAAVAFASAVLFAQTGDDKSAMAQLRTARKTIDDVFKLHARSERASKKFIREYGKPRRRR